MQWQVCRLFKLKLEPTPVFLCWTSCHRVLQRAKNVCWTFTIVCAALLYWHRFYTGQVLKALETMIHGPHWPLCALWISAIMAFYSAGSRTEAALWWWKTLQARRAWNIEWSVVTWCPPNDCWLWRPWWWKETITLQLLTCWKDLQAL